MERSTIQIRGAFEHNLKHIDLNIPRGRITVITGVSGSGKSSLAFDTILAEANRLALTPLVEAVEVPTEKVTEVRRGKKVTSDRKFFPGYVLAKLAMNDDVYHLVKNTPKVTGFLGSSGKPQPISDAEAARILNTKDEAAAAAPKARISVDYEIGDAVKVLDGAHRATTPVGLELLVREGLLPRELADETLAALAPEAELRLSF